MVTPCPITDAQIGLFNPATLINPLYEEPVTTPRPWMRIKTYVGDTAIELNRHYVTKSYRDQWLWGTISTAEFKLDDFHKLRENLPCSFVDGQKVVIRDWNNIRVLWYGFIRGVPDQVPYGNLRQDGTYRTITHVEMQDAWYLMETKTYKAFFPKGTKAGAVLKDAFKRAGFDTSNIDANAGSEVGPFQVADQYPSEIAEQMMSLLDWSYWFDIQVPNDNLLPIPYAGPKESELVRVPYKITEQNWHWVFDHKTFKLRPAQEDYANQVEYTFPRIYSLGKATFQTGSNVMLGYDIERDNKWSTIDIKSARSALTVEIPSTGASYTLQKNNSDSNGVNEFILSSEYQEEDSALVNSVDDASSFVLGLGGEAFYPGYEVAVYNTAYPGGEIRTVKSVDTAGTLLYRITLTTPLPSPPDPGDLVFIAGIDYVIKGENFTIIRNNAVEIARTRAVSGGTGIRSKKVIRTDIAQTYEQAAVTAAFEVALYSRQYWRGEGTITTSYAGRPEEGYADWLLFWVGKTLEIDLPKSKKVKTILRIEGMSRADLGGTQKFPDGAWCQILSNQLTFTPSLYQDREQIRALFKTTRKISSLSSAGSGNLFRENVVAVKDCFHINRPLGADLAASINIVEVYDTVTLNPVSGA